MAKPGKILGAIFDVDGTLLNEYSNGVGLHERARLAATHEVGRLRNIPELQAHTLDQAAEAFTQAKEHSLRGAIWQSLYILNVVNTGTPDFSHPLVSEISQHKDKLFEDILRNDGKEVPGATAFVNRMRLVTDKLAIASTACRRDIDVFLEMTNLADHFQDRNIFSIERVTHAKPHPEVFDLAFKSLQLPEHSRSNVLAFEDHPRGIASAKNAGLYVCAITTLNDRETLAALDTPPDLIAESYAEFEQVLFT